MSTCVRRYIFIAALVAALLGPVAQGSGYTTYSSRAAFDGDPIGTPRATEDFDDYSGEDCLDQSDELECETVDGVSFTSSLYGCGECGYTLIQVVSGGSAVSPPNYVSGGNTDYGEQSITMGFDPIVDAAGVDLVDLIYDPIGVLVEFDNDTSSCFSVDATAGTAFFGITSGDGIRSMTVMPYCGGIDGPSIRRGPTTSGPGTSELALGGTMGDPSRDVIYGGMPTGNEFGLDDLTFTIEYEPFCGNSIIDEEIDETCDPEGTPAGGNGNLCRDDCTSCGDEEINGEGGKGEPLEECDDGNGVDDDGCRNDCTIPVCGDETVDAQNGETCDPEESPAGGNGNLCREDCTSCGDEVVDEGEECDDGNGVDTDGCTNDCEFNLPQCHRELGPGSDPAVVEGVAASDVGIVSLVLLPGSSNVTFTPDPAFTPGDSLAQFVLTRTVPTGNSSGAVKATDINGNMCTLEVDCRDLPPGPLPLVNLCEGESFNFDVSNDDPTNAGAACCTANPYGPEEPPFGPGFEPFPPDDPKPCPVLTIDSPIAGITDMQLIKGGLYDPSVHLCFSRFDMTLGDFTPFVDATISVAPYFDGGIDPTVTRGKTQWSQTKVVCCRPTAVECSSFIDPDPDADGDGVPLCPPTGPGDCNDQLDFVYPGAPELCNGIDDNCNGTIDEGFYSGDTDSFADCFDNCPLIDNEDQADADGDGIGDVCDETYLSTPTLQYLFTDSGVLPTYPRRVFVQPVGEPDLELFASGFLQFNANVDALDVDDCDASNRILFSVTGNSFGTGAAGFVLLNGWDVYALDLDSGVVSTELAWNTVGVQIQNLDALDKLSDGSIVFSTTTSHGVLFPGGSILAKHWNLYRWDPATGMVTEFLDVGTPLGNATLVGADVLQDGRVAVSFQGIEFVSHPDGVETVYDSDIFVFDPDLGTFVEAFDGPAQGLNGVNALSLGCLSGEYPDPVLPAPAAAPPVRSPVGRAPAAGLPELRPNGAGSTSRPTTAKKGAWSGR